jgi:hypothetical protein
MLKITKKTYFLQIYNQQDNKKKSVKAVFFVSGDGLRVVDEKTRGLIVDQVSYLFDATSRRS